MSASLDPALLESESDEVRELCHFPRVTTEFSDWEKLTLSENGDLERALRRLEKRLSTFSLDLHDFDIEVDELESAIGFYQSQKLLRDPTSLYQAPKRFPNVCQASPQRLSEGEVLDLRFHSHFRPSYPSFQKEFLKYRENRDVHARMWKHPEGKNLGTVIAVHGWFMGDQRVNALALVPGFFYRMGLNVILYELPYHGRRIPAGKQGSGSLFPSAHVVRTNEAVSQAIYELRALASWVAHDNGKPLGVVGVSLGGYVASLWASLDKLSFVIPICPLVSMADLAWDVLQRSDPSDARYDHLRQITHDQLRAAYAVHCPLNFKPKTARSRRMIIGGLADSVLPATQPESLWNHWSRPKLYWFAGGHVGQVSQADAFKKIHAFFRSIKLAHPQLLNISM